MKFLEFFWNSSVKLTAQNENNSSDFPSLTCIGFKDESVINSNWNTFNKSVNHNDSIKNVLKSVVRFAFSQQL